VSTKGKKKLQRLAELVAFADLRERGIACNWATLRRMIDRDGFPSGIQLGPNRRAWFLSDVQAWLASRPAYVGPKLIGGAKLRAQGLTVRPRGKSRAKRGRP
jgi:hypothetical protein